MNLRIRLIFT